MSRSYAVVPDHVRKAILLSGVTTIQASRQEDPSAPLLAPVYAVEIAKEGKLRGDTDEAVALEISTARDDGTLQHASEFFDEMANAGPGPDKKNRKLEDLPSAALARVWKGDRQ